MKSCLSLVLLLATIFTASGQSDHSRYFSLMGDADQAIAQARWADAASALVDAMRLEPGNPSNYLLMSNLGMVQFNLGQDSLALVTLNDAHIMAPASVTVLKNRAQVLSAMGRNEEAIADYSRVIALDSALVEPRFYRAILLLSEGDTDGAEADVATLETIAPDADDTSLARAILASTTGQFRQAVEAFTRVIKNSPTAMFYAERALCHLRLENLAEAADDIASGLHLDPEDADLYLYRALLNKMRYRIDDARADAERAIKLGAAPSRVATLMQ